MDGSRTRRWTTGAVGVLLVVVTLLLWRALAEESRVAVTAPGAREPAVEARPAPEPLEAIAPGERVEVPVIEAPADILPESSASEPVVEGEAITFDLPGVVEHDLRLEGGLLAGVVVERRTGDPVGEGGIVIAIHSSPLVRGFSGKIGADGPFRLPCVPAVGELHVTVASFEEDVGRRFQLRTQRGDGPRGTWGHQTVGSDGTWERSYPLAVGEWKVSLVFDELGTIERALVIIESQPTELAVWRDELDVPLDAVALEGSLRRASGSPTAASRSSRISSCPRARAVQFFCTSCCRAASCRSCKAATTARASRWSACRPARTGCAPRRAVIKTCIRRPSRLHRVRSSTWGRIA